MKNSNAQDELLQDAKEHLDEADCYIVATKKTDHFKELEFPKIHLFVEGRKGLPSLCVAILENVYDIVCQEDGYKESLDMMNNIHDAVEKYITGV